MGDLKSSTEEILVHLIRPGVGVQDYHLAEGATLADLLRRAGTSTADQVVLVDGIPPEESLPLSIGSVVTLVPRPANIAGGEPWRASIPAFRDEALFREYCDALKARRDEDDSEEGQGG
jgi:sulfur carrier protein ThiS